MALVKVKPYGQEELIQHQPKKGKQKKKRRQKKKKKSQLIMNSKWLLTIEPIMYTNFVNLSLLKLNLCFCFSI